jgi:hypothetical protein
VGEHEKPKGGGGLDSFWTGYEVTLERVRDLKPDTLAALAKILNAFQPPSSGVAFFGNNADDHLSDALTAAGWDVRFIDGDYLYDAYHPVSGEWLHYVEGDLYAGRWRLRT